MWHDAAAAIKLVHSAAARIRKAVHPGKLHTSVAEPGDLHIDLKGPFPPSLCGKFQYAVIAIDQHTRYVFIAFIQNKSEAPEAVKKIIAEFNATVGTPKEKRKRVTRGGASDSGVSTLQAGGMIALVEDAQQLVLPLDLRRVAGEPCCDDDARRTQSVVGELAAIVTRPSREARF